ncbi:twitching motility protein PilT [Clostridiales bacterium COT073_COT-073]|nr:twitching motility protein PilT [Clostridiales bacterium COT073_COT-073]
MIRVVTGAAGEGKSKSLIAMANENLKTTKGHIVFIDRDGSHMYTLKHQVRYINTSDYPLDNHSEFFGFLCGILSRDSDICDIYVDGLFKLAHLSQIDNPEKLVQKLKFISEKFGINITIGIGCTPDKLPEALKEFEQIDL